MTVETSPTPVDDCGWWFGNSGSKIYKISKTISVFTGARSNEERNAPRWLLNYFRMFLNILINEEAKSNSRYRNIFRCCLLNLPINSSLGDLGLERIQWLVLMPKVVVRDFFAGMSKASYDPICCCLHNFWVETPEILCTTTTNIMK